MDTLNSGERQVSATLAGIRADHRFRYEWAAEILRESVVLDAACGVGYGSRILAGKATRVDAFDYEPSALAFAHEHYAADNLRYSDGDLYHLDEYDSRAPYDAVVCFEALEHMAKPGVALRSFLELAPLLVLSVPNEDEFPFRDEYAFHVRHYRAQELEELLEANGWRVRGWYGQADESAPVTEGAHGRTLVVLAEADPALELVDEPTLDEIRTAQTLPGRLLPERVAIVAMGPSAQVYLRAQTNAGDRFRVQSETWAVNAMAGVIQADRVFAMDDFALQVARAEATPDGHVAGTVDAYLRSQAPVYTPRAYPAFPTSVAYPLEWVLRRTGHSYLNNTVPYAIAYAIALGSVRQIDLYGCDFSYQGEENAAKRERGRGCVEYWIAVAHSEHIRVTIAEGSTLLDANESTTRTRFYGYHTEHLTLELDPQFGFRLARVDRRPEDIPTPDEITIRYSHDTRIEHLGKDKALCA